MFAKRIARSSPQRQPDRWSSGFWWPLPQAARVLHARFDTVVGLIHSGRLIGYLARPNWFVRGDSLAAHRRAA